MIGGGTKEEDGARSPVPLSPKARFLAGFFGVCTLGAGIAAVFVKNNNGGSLALIVVGSVFLLMAVMGYGVRSIKIAGWEVIMNAVVEARWLNDQGDREGAEERIEALIEQPVPVVRPDPTQLLNATQSHQYTSMSMARDYEQAVRASLLTALSGLGLLLPDARRGPNRFDFLARIDDLTLAIEARAGLKIRPPAFAESMRSRVTSAEVQISGLLVVVNGPRDNEIVPRLMTNLRDIGVSFLIWPWRVEDGTEQLRLGVVSLLELIQEANSGTGMN